VSENFDLIIKGGTAVTPSGVVELDLAVKDGRIAALGALDPGAAQEIVDARGLHLLPGVIDSQVHFREPGAEHKEDLASGTAAAALGGVTAVMEMPNTRPSTLGPEELADKLNRARGRAWTDHAFFIGAAEENAERLAELAFWWRTTRRFCRSCGTAAAGSRSIPRTSSACASAKPWCAAAPTRTSTRCGVTRRPR
jgi:dihydroorotase